MIALRLWWRLLRRQDSQRLTIGLALIAFATTTGVLLTVLGGLRAFAARGGEPIYLLMAQAATVILIVPVITLGGAAARLSISRRDERLAALRLAGATSGQVSLMAIADAAAQALIGALLGIGLYAAALPGIALIHFQGRAFAWSELWVGVPVLITAVAGVVVLAVISAMASLLKVAISPLGVAARTSPKKLTWLRLAVAVAVLAAWGPVFRSVRSFAELTAILVVFGICLAILNLVGPFVLGLVGRFAARRAGSVPQLLAARRLIDDPRSAWRTVAGVTMATFVSGVLSISPVISAGASDDPAERYLGVDMMTGAVLTLVIAALVAAVSSGVSQASRLLDQREQYTMLHLAGVEIDVLSRSRMRESWLPLAAAVGIAAVTSLVMIAPIGIPLIWMRPIGIVMFIGGIAVSVGLVMGAVGLSQPLVAKVATGRSRARDESLLARTA